MTTALRRPRPGSASCDGAPVVAGVDPAGGLTNLKSAFAKLSATHQELILGLRAKRTTVAAFASDRNIPPTLVRRELRVAMLLLADAGPEPAFGQNERAPWDEQRRGLLAALASAEVVMDAERRALEMIVAREPLVMILDVLTRAVEECCGTASVAAILLTSADGRCLHTGSAPSLPPEYNAAIDGLEIVPNVGTCLAAAAAREVVVTENIETDPHWNGLSHLPLGLGLRAAWSRPILGADGVLLGTFGTYFRTARRPSPTEFAVVTVLAHIAAIAIERERVEATIAGDREELQALNLALTETNASLDEFVSFISHELMTPLMAIQGNVRYLQSRDCDEDLRAELLFDVNETAVRLARRVNGLVAVARSGSAASTDLEPVRVGIAVSEICERYRTATNQIALTQAPSDHEDIVIGSSDYLDEIIANMLSNASKYGAAGGSIDVSVETDARAVRVTVSDRGRGIPDDEASYVFTRFFRGKEVGDEHSGLGIGLTVCKRLAEFMDGSISFNARAGGGTNFVLELPRAEFDGD